jgi:hypothetical protein
MENTARKEDSMEGHEGGENKGESSKQDDSFFPQLTCFDRPNIEKQHPLFQRLFQFQHTGSRSSLASTIITNQSSK